MFVGFIVCLTLTASTFAFAGQQIRVYVNNQEIYSDVPAQEIGGRVFLPVRAIAEYLGASVRWDDNQRAVYITYNGFQKQANTISDINEKINNLRSLKINVPSNQLTLGGRIFNLQTEVQIHKLRVEADDNFKLQISNLMFPNGSQLTLYGRRFQSIASMLYLGTISDDEALQQLSMLNTEWQQSIK